MIFFIVFILLILFGVVLIFGAPYLPTRRNQAEVALDLLGVKEGSVVVDLGSGDGTFLLAAAKRGAMVHGYELNPLLVAVSWLRCLRYRRQVNIKWANYWRESLPPDTDKVYVFLLARFMKHFDAKITSEVSRLNNVIDVVSYSFPIPHKKADDVKQGMFLYRYKP